ncbi:MULTISPECIES: hypothetical protein [Streptomyces]|uniref:Uncharacterized protein n=1 Tax=Streptomyces lycii TaxID=2654337 RepID=A0ABQ7FRD0_9ACTN|nr:MULTISPECIES: hypothetical protein [Streptomyces]KAF4410436.1 hypothetical protein GCU69_03805 [Streptomyces lycii]
MATQPEGAPPLSADLEDGEHSAFVDAPQVSAGADRREVIAQLHEVRRSRRVTEDAGGARLVARGEAEPAG